MCTNRYIKYSKISTSISETHKFVMAIEIFLKRIGFQIKEKDMGEIRSFVRSESLLFISAIIQYVSSRSQVKIKGLGCLAQ